MYEKNKHMEEFNDIKENSDVVCSVNDPTFVTKNGRYDIADMSPDANDELFNTTRVDDLVKESLDDMNMNHQFYDIHEVISQLRRN